MNPRFFSLPRTLLVTAATAGFLFTASPSLAHGVIVTDVIVPGAVIVTTPAPAISLGIAVTPSYGYYGPRYYRGPRGHYRAPDRGYHRGHSYRRGYGHRGPRYAPPRRYRR